MSSNGQTTPSLEQGSKPAGALKRKQKVPIMREILRLQLTTDYQIPRASFSRLVREMIQDFEIREAGMRVTAEALVTLQEASEAFLVQVFSDSYLITLNRKQVTLAQKDVQLLMRLRGPPGARM